MEPSQNTFNDQLTRYHFDVSRLQEGCPILDPISQEVMEKPVMVNGFTFDAKSLKLWLDECVRTGKPTINPLNREKISYDTSRSFESQFPENTALRKIITEFVEQQRLRSEGILNPLSEEEKRNPVFDPPLEVVEIKEPVVCGEHTLEKSVLKSWIQNCLDKRKPLTDPISGEKIPYDPSKSFESQFPVNRAVADIIARFKETRQREQQQARQEPQTTNAPSIVAGPTTVLASQVQGPPTMPARQVQGPQTTLPSGQVQGPPTLPAGQVQGPPTLPADQGLPARPVGPRYVEIPQAMPRASRARVEPEISQAQIAELEERLKRENKWGRDDTENGVRALQSKSYGIRPSSEAGTYSISLTPNLRLRITNTEFYKIWNEEGGNDLKIRMRCISKKLNENLDVRNKRMLAELFQTFLPQELQLLAPQDQEKIRSIDLEYRTNQRKLLDEIRKVITDVQNGNAVVVQGHQGRINVKYPLGAGVYEGSYRAFELLEVDGQTFIESNVVGPDTHGPPSVSRDDRGKIPGTEEFNILKGLIRQPPKIGDRFPAAQLERHAILNAPKDFSSDEMVIMQSSDGNYRYVRYKGLGSENNFFFDEGPNTALLQKVKSAFYKMKR